MKTTHSRVGTLTVRTRSRSPLRTFPQLRLGRACRGRSWLRPAGENAAVRVRCGEDRGFGCGRKHTSRLGLFGAQATRCSGPGPVVSAAGEVSGSERMPGRTRNQAGLADVTEASAHRADAGSRRRSGRNPSLRRRGSVGCGDLLARFSGRFGCFGARAVGNRQNGMKVTAAVTRYGY